MIIDERLKEACGYLNVEITEDIREVFIGGIALGLDCVYDSDLREKIENNLTEAIEKKFIEDLTT